MRCMQRGLINNVGVVTDAGVRVEAESSIYEQMEDTVYCLKSIFLVESKIIMNICNNL